MLKQVDHTCRRAAMHYPAKIEHSQSNIGFLYTLRGEGGSFITPWRGPYYTETCPNIPNLLVDIISSQDDHFLVYMKFEKTVIGYQTFRWP